MADLQNFILTSVNKVGYFLELFFQKSSGCQCWRPQTQSAGPQCASVTFKINRLCPWAVPNNSPLTAVHLRHLAKKSGLWMPAVSRKQNTAD